ncbi:MAG: hypothetical protein P1P85_02715 [Patescibacteria group bacterium]|nr:hypothetical protein [Patescibacteria group bacterium]
MNVCKSNKIPFEIILIVGIAIFSVLILSAMPQQQSEKTVTEEETDFVPFATSGTIEFVDNQFGYPKLETLPPADLGIGIEKTIIGYLITNNNDEFVLLTLDRPVDGFGHSVIIGPNERMEVSQDIAISMSFPDKRGVIGSPGNWGFISLEKYIRITS